MHGRRPLPYQGVVEGRHVHPAVLLGQLTRLHVGLVPDLQRTDRQTGRQTSRRGPSESPGGPVGAEAGPQWRGAGGGFCLPPANQERSRVQDTQPSPPPARCPCPHAHPHPQSTLDRSWSHTAQGHSRGPAWSLGSPDSPPGGASEPRRAEMPARSRRSPLCAGLWPPGDRGVGAIPLQLGLAGSHGPEPARTVPADPAPAPGPWLLPQHRPQGGCPDTR